MEFPNRRNCFYNWSYLRMEQQHEAFLHNLLQAHHQVVLQYNQSMRYELFYFVTWILVAGMFRHYLWKFICIIIICKRVNRMFDIIFFIKTCRSMRIPSTDFSERTWMKMANTRFASANIGILFMEDGLKLITLLSIDFLVLLSSKQTSGSTSRPLIS